MIDWIRVGKPQIDGYDTAILTQFLEAHHGWAKHTPMGPLTLVNGRVGVAPDPHGYGSEYMTDGWNQTNPDVLGDLDRYLAAWPAGYTGIGAFLDDLWPKWFPSTARVYGCSSGHHQMGPEHVRNSVYVTMNDAQGTAEGIYHEVGHLRLEALGIGIEQHDGRLLTNRMDELYDSSVRFDRQRPMSAVLHGLYAWLMLSENDLWCASKFSADESLIFLTPNLPKIQNGLDEVRRHARPTPEGELFLEGILAWGDDIVCRGQALIDSRG